MARGLATLDSMKSAAINQPAPNAVATPN